MKKARKAIIRLISLFHLFLVLLWIAMFFIPKSFWLEKVTFHFWYAMIVMGVQLLWGVIYFPITKRMDVICPVTTLMQWLRGYPLKSKKNYHHSYVAELLGKFKINVSYQFVNILIFISLVILFIQYFLLN